jgi:hypothetical protein
MQVSDIVSTIPNLMVFSSNNRNVHRARPSGGFPQQRAIIFASVSPVTFDGRGGVFLFFRFSDTSNPSVVYCLLTLYTVTTLTPHILAASARPRLSPNPSSKCSRILARVCCVPYAFRFLSFAAICPVRNP